MKWGRRNNYGFKEENTTLATILHEQANKHAVNIN
jgi:hypothetical protein